MGALSTFSSHTHTHTLISTSSAPADMAREFAWLRPNFAAGLAHHIV